MAAELDLSTLDIPQLQSLHKQLDDEVTLLTTNFNNLKVAQAKFNESASAIAAIREVKEDSDILVPLTSSLYVPGKMKAGENVLIDVGTGFFFSKTPEYAENFMKKKSNMLKDNTESLLKVIDVKRSNVENVAEILRVRIAAAQSAKNPSEK